MFGKITKRTAKTNILISNEIRVLMTMWVRTNVRHIFGLNRRTWKAFRCITEGGRRRRSENAEGTPTRREDYGNRHCLARLCGEYGQVNVTAWKLQRSGIGWLESQIPWLSSDKHFLVLTGTYPIFPRALGHIPCRSGGLTNGKLSLFHRWRNTNGKDSWST